MSLGNLAENIYNGNVLLDVAKQEQRKMENMLESFIEYNPVENVYENQKKNFFYSNAKEFYKGQREILIAFEENMFPLPKPYVLGKNEWKKKYLGHEKFAPETSKLSFLEEHNHTPLSEKENQL